MLSGSQKQIDWANKIVAEYIAAIEYFPDHIKSLFKTAIENRDDATYWIDCMKIKQKSTISEILNQLRVGMRIKNAEIKKIDEEIYLIISKIENQERSKRVDDFENAQLERHRRLVAEGKI
jgi:hypothetical protein